MTDGLPQDRSRVPTEAAHPGAATGMDTATYLAFMNAEDHTVAGAVGRATPAITAFVEAAADGFAQGGRLVYVGAGTSGRLGVLDASECPPTFLVDPGRVIGIIAGGDAALRKSSESLEDDPSGAIPELDALGLTERDALVGITAGGTTPYPLGAIAHAAKLGAKTALLTCGLVPDPCPASHVIHVETGPEILRGSTRLKAGSATKLVLNMISTALMHRIGKVHQGLMVDVSATNDKLRDRAARTVSELTGLARMDAFALLDQADGKVKTAVVMHRLGIDRRAALKRLDTHDGFLDAALGDRA